jgi:hypothetical protein
MPEFRERVNCKRLYGCLVHPALGKPSAHLLQVLLDLVRVVPAPHLAEVPLDDEHGQRLGSSAHTRRVSASLAGVLLRRRDEVIDGYVDASRMEQRPTPVVIPVAWMPRQAGTSASAAAPASATAWS